jgi:hypothetical protein
MTGERLTSCFQSRTRAHEGPASPFWCQVFRKSGWLVNENYDSGEGLQEDILDRAR